MAEFVVNLVLLTALLVLIVTVTAGRLRGRRAEHIERLEDRRLVLRALLPPLSEHSALAVIDALDAGQAGMPQLNPHTVQQLLQLLDRQQHRPRRRGVAAGLAASPWAVWQAGAHAGQQMSGHRPRPASNRR